MLDDIKQAVSLAKDAQKYFTEAEAKLVHAELIQALANAQIEAAELQTQLREKDAEIADLKQAALLRAKLDYDGHQYWVLDESGVREHHPICSVCHDIDGRLVRMRDIGSSGWVCDYCPTRSKR